MQQRAELQVVDRRLPDTQHLCVCVWLFIFGLEKDHPRISCSWQKNDVHQEQQKIGVRVNTNRSHHGSIDAMPHGGRQLSWI